VEKISTVPEYKKELVAELAEKMKSVKTVFVASSKGLPASQFQKIKKSLRGKAELRVARKSLILRAIKATDKGALQNLKQSIGADFVILFSDMDAFELSGLLSDSQSPAKAKAGDRAPEDLVVQEGPTELMPGPAISELGAVGLKVAVEGGKLAIKAKATVAKEGDKIDDKLASVLAKLGIEPMKVGFLPVAAYDSVSDKVYTNIKIDKEGALEELRKMIGKGFGFAVNVGYTSKETVPYFISKATLEAKALSNLSPSEDKEEEPVKESEDKKEEAAEEKVEESESKEEEKVEEKEEKGEEKVEEVKEEKSEEKEDETKNEKEDA
tara:strand:+ start:6290 stop:7264 length:975 start_codon:yes stop_codon:yes gene_type:complete